MVKSNLAASTSTTKKSVKKTKTTSKKKTSDSETKAKLVADGQKIIASAVQAAVQKTPHGRGYRNATVRLQIPSKAIALATLQAARRRARPRLAAKDAELLERKRVPRM